MKVRKDKCMNSCSHVNDTNNGDFFCNSTILGEHFELTAFVAKLKSYLKLTILKSASLYTFQNYPVLFGYSFSHDNNLFFCYIFARTWINRSSKAF